MENRLIVEGCESLGGELSSKIGEAELMATVLYSGICHRFKLDNRYGEDFVKNHQYLMGQLTIAAAEIMKKDK